MNRLTNLNPNVSNVEDYLETLPEEEFNYLSDIANSNLSDLDDDQLSDITALTLNIYASEMELDPISIIEDINMINILVKRFLSTVIIFSLLKKGFLTKDIESKINLYKDSEYKITKKGEIISNNID